MCIQSTYAYSTLSNEGSICYPSDTALHQTRKPWPLKRPLVVALVIVESIYTDERPMKMGFELTFVWHKRTVHKKYVSHRKTGFLLLSELLVSYPFGLTICIPSCHTLLMIVGLTLAPMFYRFSKFRRKISSSSSMLTSVNDFMCILADYVHCNLIPNIRTSFYELLN